MSETDKVPESYENLPILELSKLPDGCNLERLSRLNNGEAMLAIYLLLAILDPGWISEFAAEQKARNRINEYITDELARLQSFMSQANTKAVVNLLYKLVGEPNRNFENSLKLYERLEQCLLMRAMEFLSEDFPNLCQWRAADFNNTSGDSTQSLETALGYVNRSGVTYELRKQPVIVQIPLAELVEAFKKSAIDISLPSMAFGWNIRTGNTNTVNGVKQFRAKEETVLLSEFDSHQARLTVTCEEALEKAKERLLKTDWKHVLVKLQH